MFVVCDLLLSYVLQYMNRAETQRKDDEDEDAVVVVVVVVACTMCCHP